MFAKLMISLMMWWMQSCTPAAAIQLQPPEAEAPPAVAPAEPPPEQSKEEPPVENPAPAEAPKPQIAPEVNDLLDRLEKSHAQVKTLTADIQYEKQDALLGRKELRAGDLIYEQHSDAKTKRFAVMFETTIIDKVSRGETKHYIFSGRWLAEIDFKNKQFIKMELVPPGKQLDPLKLGEGPFPLPIGQTKEQVLREFDVSPLTVPEKGLLSALKDVDGLTLVPKEGGRVAKDFTRIDVFFDRTTLLPAGLTQVEVNGDQKTVRFNNIERNPELTASQLKRLDITDPDPREWKIDIQPWRGGE